MTVQGNLTASDVVLDLANVLSELDPLEDYFPDGSALCYETDGPGLGGHAFTVTAWDGKNAEDAVKFFVTVTRLS